MPEAKPIAVLQKYLGYLGFEISDVSGTLGQSTVAALKRFQKEHGLKVTGEIDDPTALGIWLEAVVVRTMVDIDLQKCLRDRLVQYLDTDDVAKATREPFKTALDQAITAVLAGLERSLTTKLAEYVKQPGNDLSTPFADQLGKAADASMVDVVADLSARLTGYLKDKAPAETMKTPFTTFVNQAVASAITDVYGGLSVKLADYFKDKAPAETMKTPFTTFVNQAVASAITDVYGGLSVKLADYFKDKAPAETMKTPFTTFVNQAVASAITDVYGGLSVKLADYFKDKAPAETMKTPFTTFVNQAVASAITDVYGGLSVKLADYFKDKAPAETMKSPLQEHIAKAIGGALEDIQKEDTLAKALKAYLAKEEQAAAISGALQVSIGAGLTGALTGFPEALAKHLPDLRQPMETYVTKGLSDVLDSFVGDLGVPVKLAQSRLVSGRVLREDKQPCRSVLVRAFHIVDKVNRERLGEDTTDDEGAYTIRYAPLPGVERINLGVVAFSKAGTLLSGPVIVPNAEAREIVNLTVPVQAPPAAERQLEGRIRFDNGLPAEGITLRLYSRGFGGTAHKLAETTSLAGGVYVLSYTVAGKHTSFDVRALDEKGNEIAISKTMHDLGEGKSTVVNLVAPATLKAAAAEYTRLALDLQGQVGEMKNLATARENAERQDLTMLNRATGWDARLIALAATTERLSADGVALPREALYGLLRAGLPSDKLLLAQVKPDVAELALQKMRAAGIVSLSDQQIAQVKQQFTTFANSARLGLPAPGSQSSYGDLLQKSGLLQSAQDAFASVYFAHRGDAAQLWDAADKAEVTTDDIVKLKLQGKLALLAGNSAPMTARLLQKQIDGKPIDDPAQLVDQGFHRAAAWVSEVYEQAEIPAGRRGNLTDEDKKKLNAAIPSAYAGDTVQDRLQAYAHDMARKVRLSYPTQVVRLMIEQDEIKLPAGREATVTLLKNATSKGFRMGETPVKAFVRDNPGVRGTLADEDFQKALQHMQMVQRVYQITPSNDAMPVLISLHMTSAYDIMAYPEEQFLDLYRAKHVEMYGFLPDTTLAKLIYRKAQQVSSVTYNLFTIAKKLDSEPPVAGMSAPEEVRTSVRNELIKQFPTVESLFGSIDFCECEHCRSVLSPAAYLVDLLQFVDIEEGVWGNFTAQWAATHGGQEYPYKDADGKPMKPYDVLVLRRPDLPNIALTCENTNVALPYIDIVNEILEYYVAHDKLEAKAAHDTVDATTAELLAEPQNVISDAYNTLREHNYPLNLPFDLWIETVRQFCTYFETPLARVLDVFRPTDDLFAPAKTFDRASIFIESLGLSPAEAALFTNADPLSSWHTLYGYDSPAEATTHATDPVTHQRTDLNSAKALSRRLNLTYRELTQIVKTGFVNPELAKLALLYKLGVSIQDARFYLDHKNDSATATAEEQKRHLEVQAFTQKLDTLADTFHTTADYLEGQLQAIPFSQILVLADRNAGGDFDQTTLQYADGTAADAMSFLRINLFVRLWRKLGWTIEETDRALCTFTPKNTPYDAAHVSQQPLRTALVYLAHLKALDEKVRAGKQSRIKLLTLWSDIPTMGEKPLYAQLFLTHSVLKSDPVFDHPLGQYLPGTADLKDHLLALQGALGLTAEEIGLILVDAGLSVDTAKLSLDNVSLLYRYGLLAKALKLPVHDLITLKQLSGRDPFKDLSPDPLADAALGVVPAKKVLELDYPFSETLRFVEISEQVEDSGLKVEDLDYVLRHRFDEAGAYRPNRDAALALLASIARGVRSIRSENAVPDDPGGLSDETLQQKLGLVLPPDVVERFLAMMNGSVEFTATKAGVASADQLKPEQFADEPAIRALSYNATRQEQKLTFRGVLFPAQKADLEARLPTPAPSTPHVASPIFAALLDDVQQQARSFFKKYLQKQEANVQPASGFLDAADFDLLFDQNLALAAGETQQDQLRKRRTKLAEAFLPFLQERLIRQLIVQTLAAYTAADAALVESLVTDQRLLESAASTSLLRSFADLGQRGVTGSFFASADGKGPVQETILLADADSGLKDKNKHLLRPDSACSACLDGYLEVPAPGAYRFLVNLDKAGADAALRFHHLPKPEFWSGVAVEDNDVLGTDANDYLELNAGIPYHFTLDLHNLNGGDARMQVQGETIPKDRLSQLTLYPSAAMSGADSALLLLAKALQLAQSLGLSERELRYLLTHPHDFGDWSLSELPTSRSGQTAAEQTAATLRCTRFLRAAAYARLKRALAAGTADLIDIFEANDVGNLDQVYTLIARLTRREQSIVKATAEALLGPPAFASEEPLQRLWEALQVIQRFGVPVASLRGWLPIVNSSATPEQRFAMARDLKEAVKARFEPETWQGVAQPIFDRLRQRQRDALAAYVMQQLGFARLEQLYEHFLIDPGMEPVVQTSRIRLAIASLQVFIQRCLLNMEAQVHPSCLNAKQWEWMKRYRVWEANRKIFLFPENWLEPEFRDDKSHLFTELEGALLQGDVSSDLVEDAFLTYLKKLDELARLDIAAMHIEDNADPALRVLHVIGRTYSQPHKYFYRRYAHQMWTPWEPVSAEIEGDHLAPVIWRDRLYLFWVTFIEKAKPTATDITVNFTDAITIPSSIQKEVEAHLHWSEYVQGAWTTMESGNPTPPEADKIKADVALDFHPSKVFIHVSKEYEEGEERGVCIHLGDPINQAFYLAGRNSAPEKEDYGAGLNGAKPDNRYSANAPLANRYVGSGQLTVNYTKRITSQIPLYRLWNRGTGDHFYTVWAGERDQAVARSGYVYEGIACDVLPPGSGVPLYRLYLHLNGDHFYTIHESERQTAINKYGYVDEGIACGVDASDGGSCPLYRLCSPITGDHFYTTSASERYMAIKDDSYVEEGIACWVPTGMTSTTQAILDQGGAYTLLPCDNNLMWLGVSEDAYKTASHPSAVQAAIQDGLGEIATLIKPVFYQDNAHAFFVEPNLTERTIENWQGWIAQTAQSEPEWEQPRWWDDLVVVPEVPWHPPLPDPKERWDFGIDPRTILDVQVGKDWLVNPTTGLEYDGVIIGPAGWSGLEMARPGAALQGVAAVNINPAAAASATGTLVAASAGSLEKSGVVQPAGGLNVVGKTGFNSALMKNFQDMNRSAAGAARR